MKSLDLPAILAPSFLFAQFFRARVFSRRRFAQGFVFIFILGQAGCCRFQSQLDKSAFENFDAFKTGDLFKLEANRKDHNRLVLERDSLKSQDVRDQ